MEKMMGDLEHLLKSSNDLEMSERRSSDFSEKSARALTGSVQEQLDVTQHHHVVQSSGWSQKMPRIMRDLKHLLKSSDNLQLSERRSSDFSEYSDTAL
jgi:hypothetical protein